MSKFTNQGIRATLTHYMDATAHGLTDEHTEEDLVNDISKQCGVNPEIWKIDRHRITGNAWTVNGKFGSGKNTRWEEAVNGQLKCVIDYIRIAPDNNDEFKQD